MPAKQKTILDRNKIFDVSELFRCYFDLYSMFYFYVQSFCVLSFLCFCFSMFCRSIFCHRWVSKGCDQLLFSGVDLSKLGRS